MDILPHVISLLSERNGLSLTDISKRYLQRIYSALEANPVTVIGFDLTPFRLIILLALLLGVLYSIHILVKDYQALTAASKLLRFIFKRDINTHLNERPSVRWKRILLHDPIQCARYLFCDLGANPPNNDVGWGFIYMLSLEAKEENANALAAFKEAYNQGKLSGKTDHCQQQYPLCIFDASLLHRLVQYLLNKQ